MRARFALASGVFAVAALVGPHMVSADTFAAPVTIAQPPLQHHYRTGGTNPPGSIINDGATLFASSIVPPGVPADRFEATLAAPTGYKFVVNPAPTPYETKMLLILSWGNSSAGAPPPISEPPVFADLVGIAPLEISRSDHTENSLIRVRSEFLITSPVEFTSLTLSFLGFGNTTQTLSPQPSFSVRAYSPEAGLADVTLLQIVPIPEPGAGIVLAGLAMVMLRRSRV